MFLQLGQTKTGSRALGGEFSDMIAVALEAVASWFQSVFNKHVIRHQFCKTCGCAPFAEETGPDGEAMVVINLRCAEDVDLSRIKITPFDGASL